eukprot:g8373.t1
MLHMQLLVALSLVPLLATGDDMLMSGPPDPFQQLQPMTFLPMPWQEQQPPQGPQQSGVQPMTMPMNLAQHTQMFSGGPQIGGMQDPSSSGGMVVVPAGSVVGQGGGGPQGFASAPVPVGYVPMPQSRSDTGIGYVPGHPVPMIQAPQQAGGDQQSQQLQMQLIQGFNLFQQTLMQQQMGGQYAPMVQPGGMMMAPLGSFVHPSQQPLQTPGPPYSNKDAPNKRERKTRAPVGDEKARRRGAGGNIGGGGRGDFPAEKFGSYTFPPNKKVGEVWHPNPTQGSRTLPSFFPQSESAGGTPAGSSEYSGAHSMFSFGSSSLQFAPDGAFGGGKGSGKNKRGGGRADASIPGPARGVTATLDLLPEHFEFLQEGGANKEVVEDTSADKTSSASTTEVSGSGAADSGMPGAASAPATATTLGAATVAPRAPAPAAKSYADALLKGVSRAAKEKASATTSSSSPAAVVPSASSSAAGGASSSPPPRPILIEDAARVVRKMEDTLAWKMVRLSAEDPVARKSFLNLAKSQEGSIVLQRKLTRIEVVGDDLHVEAASAKDTCAQKEYDELLADLFDLRAVEISSTRLYLFPETAANSEEGLVTTAPLPTPDGDYIDIPVNTEIRRAVARQNAQATSNYFRRGQPAGASTSLSDAVNAVSPTSTSSAAAAATTLSSATRLLESADSDSACAFLRLLFAHVKRSFDSMLGDVHANRVLEVVLELFPAVWLVIVKSLVETRKQRIRELLMQHQQAAAGAEEALPPGRCDDHASAPLSSEIGIRLIRSGDRFVTSDTGTTGYPVSEALTRQLIEDAGGSPGSPGSRTLVLYNSPDDCIVSKEMRKMSWSKVAVRAFQRFYWQYGKYVAERDREGGVFKRRGRATRSEDLDEYSSESDDLVVKKHRQGIEVLMQELTELYLPDLEFGLRKSGLPSGSDPSMVGRNRNTWTQKDLNRQLLGNKDQGITYLHIYRYLLQRGTEIGRSYAVGQQEDSRIGQLRLEDDEEVVDVDMLGGDAPQSCLHLQEGTLSGEDVAEGDDAAGAGCGGDPDLLDDGFVTPCSALPPSDEDEEQTADEDIPDGMEAELLPKAAAVKPKKKGSAPAEVVTTLETIGGRPVPPYTVKNTFVDVADSPGMTRFPDAISPPALAERGNSAPTPTLASLVSSQDSLAAAGAPGGAGSAKPEEGEALGVLRQTSRFFGAGEAPSEEAEVHGEQ